MAQSDQDKKREIHPRDIVQMQEFINEYDDSIRYSPPEGPAEGARDTAQLDIKIAQSIKEDDLDRPEKERAG